MTNHKELNTKNIKAFPFDRHIVGVCRRCGNEIISFNDLDIVYFGIKRYPFHNYCAKNVRNEFLRLRIYAALNIRFLKWRSANGLR